MGAALQADGENEVRGFGLKHQKEKRSMDHFAGLDVSVKETSVCIVDDKGEIVREVKVKSEPEALLAALKNPFYQFKRMDWKPDHCRNGCSALSSRLSYRWSVSRRGTCRRY